MSIACLMPLEESYVRHPSCGSNAEPKVTAACNAQRKVMELRFPSPGLRLAVGVILSLIISTNPFLFIFLLRVTPTANRNSYRVATPYYIYTQGSVLRPQPWAGETQLLQSCRCLCWPLSEPHQERKGYNKPHPNHLHQEEGVFSNCLKYSKKKLLPLGEGRDGAFV